MSATYRIDTDHSVQELMEAAAQKIFNLQNRGIRIGVQDDAVFLQGNVASWSDKQILQETIRPFAGSRIIANEVEVMSACFG